MHTIKLNVGENAYAHLMFLLNNLKTNEIKIVEDRVDSADETSSFIDMSEYKIETFKSISNPVQWQQDIRNEWN